MRIIIINLGWFLKVLVSSIGVYDKWSLKTVQTEICGRLNKTPQDALQISGIDISREGFASYFCLRESPKQKVHVLRCHISALHRKQITNHKITICLLEEEEEEEEEKEKHKCPVPSDHFPKRTSVKLLTMMKDFYKLEHHWLGFLMFAMTL